MVDYGTHTLSVAAVLLVVLKQSHTSIDASTDLRTVQSIRKGVS